MKNFKILISLISALVLLLTATACSDKHTVKSQQGVDYEQGSKLSAGDNLSFTKDGLTLSVDADTCNVTVTENESGRKWCSNPEHGYADEYAAGISKTNIFSQLTVSFVGKANTVEKTNSYVSSVKRKNYSIFKTENGFRVEYSFKEGFMIPVEYAVINGAFEATVLYTGITEEDGNAISTVNLLPYFGTATTSDSGFLLVPDGLGAVINFNNGKNDCSAYEKKVYGTDESLPNDIVTSRSEQIYIPLIGMKRNDGAYMAFVSRGAADATVKAATAGIETGFNSISFSAAYRAAENLSVINGALGTAGLVMYSAEEPTDAKRFTVRYAFSKENNPTLGSMVMLAKEKLLGDNATAKDEATLYVDLYGGVAKQKSFLGIGMKRNDGAYMAFVSRGAADATVKAATAGIETGFNSISFSAAYRAAENLSVINGALGTAGLVMYSAEEPTDAKRFTVRYAFSKENNPTLGSMVMLAKEKLLGDNATAKDEATLYVDLYGGVAKQKSFLGIQYTGIDTLTTFEQAQELLKSLREDGAQALTVGYKSFSQNRFSGKLMTDLTPISELGGKKGLRELADFAEENNADLYLEADFYSFTSSGDGFSKYFDITKRLDLGAAQVYHKKINTNLADKTRAPYYMLKPALFIEAAQKLLKSAQRLDVSGIYLQDISNSLAGDYGLGGVKRSGATEKADEAVSLLKDKSIMLSAPNYYLWGTAEKITNLPVSSSKHLLFDYDVPMLQLLLKGSLPYAGYPLNLSNTSDNTYLLHIAYAQNIHYAFMADDAADLQGTELAGAYGLSRSRLGQAAERAEEFSRYYSIINGCSMTDYILFGDISKTVYSNGCYVLVNYSEQDNTVDSITVSARGWTVVKDGMPIFTGGEQ